MSETNVSSILIRGGLILADADSRPVPGDVLVDGTRIVGVGAGLEPYLRRAYEAANRAEWPISPG